MFNLGFNVGDGIIAGLAGQLGRVQSQALALKISSPSKKLRLFGEYAGVQRGVGVGRRGLCGRGGDTFYVFSGSVVGCDVERRVRRQVADKIARRSR